MSRTVAQVVNSLVDLATLPLNARQKNKTVARVTEELARRGLVRIETARGPLSFYSMRGHGVVSAVRNFHQEEPETLGWIDNHVKPGHVLWDIGANIGLYSLYAALNPDVQVYAFEPSALNFGLLVEHIHLNKLGGNISPLCLALGDSTQIGHLTMNEFSAGHAGNSLEQSENAVFQQAIPAMRGDDFTAILKARQPDHIKLDVDGIEDLILAGMPGVLQNVKTLVIEVEGSNAENARNAIEGPLNAAGLKEDLSFRQQGSKRNRLFVR